MRFREFLESYDKLGSGIKKGHTLEARGTKGPDNKEWAKSFKDKAELDAWVKDNDAKVFGIAYAEKVSEAANTDYRVDRTDNLKKTPIGMNSIIFIGNNLAAAKRAFNSAKTGINAWDKPDASYGVILSKWNSDKNSYIVIDAKAHDNISESVGLTPWEIINDIVSGDHGEESILHLTVTEVGKILDLGKADELAKKEFFDLPEGKMKALVNAHPELLKGKAARVFKKQLSEDELNEAKPDKDGIMPLSYKAGAGHKIEAYGVKGMKNTQWRKTFKNREALDKWVEANDAEVYGTAEID